MLCAPLRPSPTEQVWPGSGIDIFSTDKSNVSVSVVSTFSQYLNFERWYFASAVAAEWDSELTFKPGLPQRTNPKGDSIVMDYAESYIDRAVLTDADWKPYGEPLQWPRGYQWETYRAILTPVRVEGTSVAVGEPVEVWVQFWRLAGALVQIYWYISRCIQWAPGAATHLPSAFVVPENGHTFHRTDRDTLPRVGFFYCGGMRPAPWAGG